MNVRLAVSLILAAALLAGAALADAIFPPLVEGKYRVRIEPAPNPPDAEGVPSSTPTVSVGLVRVDATDAPLVAGSCVNTPTPDIVPVEFTIPASGSRAELRAVAYSGADCTGERSTPSDTGAYLFFVPPAAPALAICEGACLDTSPP